MSNAAKSDASANLGAGLAVCPACNAKNVRLKNVDGIMICDQCASKNFSTRVRKSIQEAYERKIEAQKREAYARRLQVTRKGHEHLERAQISEAVACFEKYVEILETRYKTSKTSLHPHLFQGEQDREELLLATAVFWDLARVYDRIKGQEQNFRFYLRKYVEFSMGSPHMVLSAETLRKYLKFYKGEHKKDLEQAHNALRAKMPKCFIATSVYGPEHPSLDILRDFRDEYLLRRPLGRAAVHTYYLLSPPVAAWLPRNPWARDTIKVALDLFVSTLKEYSAE